MSVVFDATFLILFLDDRAPTPKEPNSDTPVTQARKRVSHLIATLEHDRTSIIIPTPALSELLVKADQAGPDWLNILSKSKWFKIEPFDTLAAVEAAAAFRDAYKDGDFRSGLIDVSKQKIKFDRQIIAIAKVAGANTIYTYDKDIEKLLRDDDDIDVVHVADLPFPAEDPQLDMFNHLKPEENED